MDKLQALIGSIQQQFTNRAVVEGRKRGIDFGISLDIEVRDGLLWLNFERSGEVLTVTVPVPYQENGVWLITSNDVTRALCKYFIVATEKEVDYFTAIDLIINNDPSGIIPEELVKTSCYIQQIIYAFQNGNASIAIYNLQRAINDVVNKMPLHNTYLNSWVMNHRLLFIDPVFDDIVNPREKLDYQIDKNIRFFEKGWTSIGLSDGSLADKNYILTTDIRKLTPFGLYHHNPQRNLYSTLGMKGDEEPLVRSTSMQELMNKGVNRKGWNLFTAFIDVPDVFEDQLLVDESHANKYVEFSRRYQCFGEIFVKAGDRLKRGQVLSKSNDGEVKRFKLRADHAEVDRVTGIKVNVGGMPIDAHNVIVKFRRKFRDGMKLTNLHGNKGVIRLKKLGHAVDPTTGELRKIDIISAAKSVKKRKNHGQIIEALMNNIHRDLTENGQALVFSDDWKMNDIKLFEDALEDKGFRRDGTWDISIAEAGGLQNKLPCQSTCSASRSGELTAVCGTVFWGAIHHPEDTPWTDDDTRRVNGRNLRVAGLKFSPMELRGIGTRFGKDNPIAHEILSYAQGSEDIHELLKILQSKMAKLPQGYTILDSSALKAVDQSSGIIVEKELIDGTVVDECFFPDGFILRLPIPYQVILDENGVAEHEGYPQPTPVENSHTFSHIFIPSSNLRRSWRHETGKYGLSEVGNLVNNIVIMCHRFSADPQNPTHLSLLMRHIFAYFKRISDMLGTKRGDLSVYGMSVRYPYSAKGVATISNRLPKNTIEIHRDMAKQLEVGNGDIVLVERFPCMGFMSIRPQKVHVTDDPNAKYTIRVSSNCLVSMGLDFDGDVLFVASFHTSEAKEALLKEWTNPNEACYKVIQELNSKAGKPHTLSLTLDEYGIEPFEDLTAETHAALVDKATGVKAHTGPVIALAYNIMRIVENSRIKDDRKINVAVEYFLDRVGNTVFKQKHGILSLHDIVTDAICGGDVDTLVEHGFPRDTSTIICNIIAEKARGLGVSNLTSYHQRAKENGWSNIINRIVREQNKVYFASRAKLEGCALMKCLEAPAVDLPSAILQWSLSGKSDRINTPLDLDKRKKMLNIIKDGRLKDACQSICDYFDEMMSGVICKPDISGETLKHVEYHMKKLRREVARRATVDGS